MTELGVRWKFRWHRVGALAGNLTTVPRHAALLFLAMAGFIASGHASAFEGDPAKKLLESCEVRGEYCKTFLTASLEAHELLGQYVLMVSGSQLLCLPEDVSIEQVRQLIGAHDKARPGDRSYTGGVYVTNVLEQAYPCHR